MRLLIVLSAFLALFLFACGGGDPPDTTIGGPGDTVEPDGNAPPATPTNETSTEAVIDAGPSDGTGSHKPGLVGSTPIPATTETEEPTWTPVASLSPTPTEEPSSTPTSSETPSSSTPTPTSQDSPGTGSDSSDTPTPEVTPTPEQPTLQADWIEQVAQSGFGRYTYDTALDAEAQDIAERGAVGPVDGYVGYEAPCNYFAPDGSYLGKPVRPMGDDEYKDAAYNIWAYTGQNSGWLKWHEFESWSAGAVRTDAGIVAIILVCVAPEPESATLVPTATPVPTAEPVGDRIIYEAGTGDARSARNILITESSIGDLYGDTYFPLIGPCQTADGFDAYDSFDLEASEAGEALLIRVMNGEADAGQANIGMKHIDDFPGALSIDVLAGMRDWIIGEAALTTPCPTRWWHAIVFGRVAGEGFHIAYIIGQDPPKDAVPVSDQIVELTNEARQTGATCAAYPDLNWPERAYQPGAQALIVDPDLTANAQAHAEYMAATGDYRHQSEFDLRAAGAQSENIAWISDRSDVAESFVSGWLNSAGHCHNLMAPERAAIGVGVAQDSDGKIYAVQVFWDTPLAPLPPVTADDLGVVFRGDEVAGVEGIRESMAYHCPDAIYDIERSAVARYLMSESIRTETDVEPTLWDEQFGQRSYASYNERFDDIPDLRVHFREVINGTVPSNCPRSYYAVVLHLVNPLWPDAGTLQHVLFGHNAPLGPTPPLALSCEPYTGDDNLAALNETRPGAQRLGDSVCWPPRILTQDEIDQADCNADPKLAKCARFEN